MRLSISWLVVAVLVGSVFTYPASRKLDLAEELLAEESDGDYQYDEVELKPDEAIKKSEVAREGSGAEPARKDDVSGIKPAEAVKGEATKKEEVVLKDNSKVVDNPESDESESPASGEEDSSGDDTADDATSGNGVEDALEEGDATSRNGMTAALEETDPTEKRNTTQGNTETAEGTTDDDEDESKYEGQEIGEKKKKIAKSKPSICKRDCDCCCDEPDEEHEHEHQCHGQEECCHGEHCCEHEHGHDQGHHQHEDCCHHHGHHHGFVHEWGEECCGDHDCHDCCGEHEHCHHDNGEHEHEHCCHDNHCCHHQEEGEPCCCCCHKRSKCSKAPSRARTYVEHPSVLKKQTVHVGYGYSSGDNYRLGYQQGGMGALASAFSGGEISAQDQEQGVSALSSPPYSEPIADQKQRFESTAHQYSKRDRGPVRQKRHFYGSRGFGNMESGMAHGSATPYGHPVTHPGFTTMGFPGHALASQDVRNTILHPKVKRHIYETDYPVPLEYIHFV